MLISNTDIAFPIALDLYLILFEGLSASLRRFNFKQRDQKVDDASDEVSR